MANILLVETDRLLADYYQDMIVRHTAHHLIWARSAQAAINIIDRKPIELIISELVLDSHNGVELLHELRSYEDWSGIPIIFISSIESADIPIPRNQWDQYGIKEFISKSRLSNSKPLVQAVTAVLP